MTNLGPKFPLARLGAVIVVLVAAFAPGCASQGPSRMSPDRFSYNEAISKSWKEQLLLNIVRLRYGDTPVFLNVSSVLTQYVYSASAGASASIGLDGAGDTLGASAVGRYEERPTVAYSPLEGEELVRQLLTPVPPDLVLFLPQSGWDFERVLMSCVERINGVRNPLAFRAETEFDPDTNPFLKATRALGFAQQGGAMQYRMAAKGEAGPTIIHVRPAAERPPEAAELFKLLRVEPVNDQIVLTRAPINRLPNELALQTMPVIGVMSILSDQVEVPAAHIADGRAPPSARPGRAISPRLVTILTSEKRPESAFVEVFYEGHWFYVPHSEFETKRLFSLLRVVLSLQASSDLRNAPIITVPAGGD